ncbi:MAG: hypothetical protein LBV43_10340 [Prevotella sp.]|jgi:hypothetical protein|nr:hypothetical protein [Prevotella sp.]
MIPVKGLKPTEVEASPLFLKPSVETVDKRQAYGHELRSLCGVENIPFSTSKATIQRITKFRDSAIQHVTE